MKVPVPFLLFFALAQQLSFGQLSSSEGNGTKDEFSNSSKELSG